MAKRRTLPPGVTKESEAPPTWRVKLRVGKDPMTGKWRWANRKFGTERAALDFYDKTKRAIQDGVYALPTATPSTRWPRRG